MTHLDICSIINQIFAIESRVKSSLNSEILDKRFKRLFTEFEQLGYTIHNPIGESYDMTRSDCEATISGDQTSNLVIVEVLKPIIFKSTNSERELEQRGIVIVQSEQKL